MKEPELLAPSGNLAKLKYAFVFGADAVYCGIPDFSLRVRINDFNLKSLEQGIKYAHSLGKKVYVTVNIFAHQKHLKKLKTYILKLKKMEPDALIVSDPGVISEIKKLWPSAVLHLSTQANCTNAAAAKFWFKQGIKRIILAREVTLSEIKEIHRCVPEVELEYFVHGAMCMSYSGRCLLSKFFTDKSANLGDCTQPCRWKYKIKSQKTKVKSRPNCHSELVSESLKLGRLVISEEKRPDSLLEMEEDEHGSYIMNSKDLCLVEHLPELMKAGVTSFKIEGRAKSIYYVGNTVKVYREAISLVKSQKLKNKSQGSFINELKKCQNRGFTSGFLFGKEKCEQNVFASQSQCDWEFCGEVLDWKNGLAKIRPHNQLYLGDELEFVVPNAKNVAYKVKKMYNSDRQEIEEAHGGQGAIIHLPVKDELQKMTLMRRKLKNTCPPARLDSRQSRQASTR